jgi:hypothetical protein
MSFFFFFFFFTDAIAMCYLGLAEGEEPSMIISVGSFGISMQMKTYAVGSTS